MGIEAFPDIENFQKLPHQVIVKGGSSNFSASDGAELRGIVINNIGNTVRDIKINLVVFNDQKIPLLNTSVKSDPEVLPQGTIGTFIFKIKEHAEEITDYHLYADWRFDDSE